MKKSVAEARLAIAKADLETIKAAYTRTLNAQSWSTRDGNSSREVRNANVTALYNQMVAKQKEVDRYEAIIEGFSNDAVRVGVKW